MSINFSMQITPLSQKRMEILAKAWRTDFLKPVIIETGIYMKTSIEANFEAEGRPRKWGVWSKDYEKLWRAKMNGSYSAWRNTKRNRVKGASAKARGVLGKKLVLIGKHSSGRTYTGKLKSQALGSLKYRYNGWQFTSDLPYSKMMQYGGLSKGKIIGYVKPRPFLLFQEGDKRHIKAMVNGFILNYVKKLEAGAK